MKIYNRTRCRYHDYRSKCTYLITLTKEPGVEPFSYLFGTKEKRFSDAGVRYTEIGRLIKDTIRALPERFPSTRINRYIVMPDHVHFIIEILEPNRYHLGEIIGRLTRDCNVAVPKYHQLFEHGYHDRILGRKGQLNIMRNYIKDNPRRRLIKDNMDYYFKSPMLLNLFGKDYVVFGNFFLLKDPDKTAVRISSKFTDQELAERISSYEETIRCGGILISPFISEKEKIYRDQAIENGANLIIISRQPIGKYFKPSGWLFNLWSEGRLLIISTYQPDQKEKLTRQEAVTMNALAGKLESAEFNELTIRPLRKN